MVRVLFAILALSISGNSVAWRVAVVPSIATTMNSPVIPTSSIPITH